jgi:signal transduction histidine kinase
MTNLLEDVITVGKSEEDMLSYIPATIDLPLEINRLLDEVRIIDNNNHGIIFVNELIQDKVLSDAKHLRHIILNLLTNACKYSLPGKTIRISTKEEGDKITISVLDEGIGIPEPDIKHIFEPFFRNKDYIGQIPGSGLGLTIVKRSSDAIGGIITFSSKVNEGTEFKLSFPIKRKNSTH